MAVWWEVDEELPGGGRLWTQPFHFLALVRDRPESTPTKYDTPHGYGDRLVPMMPGPSYCDVDVELAPEEIDGVFMVLPGNDFAAASARAREFAETREKARAPKAKPPGT